MQIHTDAIIFGMSFISMVTGFALGRWEKKDAQVRTYRMGFNIGKQVGKSER